MSTEENRARAADLRRRGAIMCGRGAPTEGDLDAVQAFADCLRETPKGLLAGRPQGWPSHFPERAAFEAWRARWLPYLAGLAAGPSTAAEWPDYRTRILADRATSDLTEQNEDPTP